jgi:hypothetical protein
VYLGVQECRYDWDTGEIDNSWNYGAYWDGETWYWDLNIDLEDPDSYFSRAGGLVDCPSPVAIPASVLLLGSGLLGLICIGFRRRKSTAA